MDYNSSRNGAKPKPNDRADPNFARLLASGNTTVQAALPPSGPYHVNHFICYFTIDGETFTDPEGQKTAGILTYRFLKNFCLIFSQHNIARAQIGPRGLDVFDGSIAIEFTIGSNVGTLEHRAMGFMHPDWVAMSSVPPITIAAIDSDQATELKSFHGDTLKRLWSTEVEKKIISEGTTAKSLLDLQKYIVAVLPSPLSTLMLMTDALNNRAEMYRILGFNRQHFLAGTRSWRVGYDTSRKQFLVETITIERFSCIFYRAMESLHSTRNDIISLWDNLINNVIKTKAFSPYRFTSVPPPDTLTKNYGYAPSSMLPHIRHNAWQYKDLASLLEEFLAKASSPAMKAIRESHSGLHVHLKP
jgi:hypothetical protein